MKKMITQKFMLCLVFSMLFSYAASAQWSLTGNAGTNPLTNFLGTTDAQRLVFRTAGTEKATILQNGSVGIGIATPAKLLHIHNSNQNTEDNNVFLSGRAPGLYFSQSITQPASQPFDSPYARIGLSTRAGTFVLTSQPGDFVIHAITRGKSLLFGTGVNSPGNNGIERARIDSGGNLGINTTAPTAKLHVNGTVRFQNLPSGSGSILVIDSTGRVFRSTSSARTLSEDDAAAAASTRQDVASLQQEVSALKQALADIQSQLSALKSGTLQIATDIEKSYVLANTPNPFSGTTTIKYAYRPAASKAFINVTDLNGKQLKRFDLKANSGNSITLTLDGSAYSGTYIYSLEVDGRVIESKKMVLTK